MEFPDWIRVKVKTLYQRKTLTESIVLEKDMKSKNKMKTAWLWGQQVVVSLQVGLKEFQCIKIVIKVRTLDSRSILQKEG